MARIFRFAWLGYLLDGFDFVLIALVPHRSVVGEFGLTTVVARQVRSRSPLSPRRFGGLMPGALRVTAYGRRLANGHQHRFSAGRLACGLRQATSPCLSLVWSSVLDVKWVNTVPAPPMSLKAGQNICVTKPVVSFDFRLGAVVAAQVYSPVVLVQAGVRCSLSAFCQSSLASGCVKTFRKRRLERETRR